MVHSCVIYKETVGEILTHELFVSSSITITGKVQGSNYNNSRSTHLQYFYLDLQISVFFVEVLLSPDLQKKNAYTDISTYITCSTLSRSLVSYLFQTYSKKRIHMPKVIQYQSVHNLCIPHTGN